ncbi:MAG: hypothetical protein WBX25_10550 [Rhodomicrobium sp.]
MSGIAHAHATFSEFLNDPEMLGSFFAAESWGGWKTIAKVLYSEKLTKAGANALNVSGPMHAIVRSLAGAGHRTELVCRHCGRAN